MTNRLLMKFTEKHMNEILTRDLLPLKPVLIDMFSKNLCHLQLNVSRLPISWCAAALDRNILQDNIEF